MGEKEKISTTKAVSPQSKYTDKKDVVTKVSCQDEGQKETKSELALAGLRDIVRDMPKEFDIPQNALDYKAYIKTCNVNAKIESDREYVAIVRNVVDFSQRSLNRVGEEKSVMRESLISFCTNMLGVQLGVLFVFMLFKAVFPQFNLSDSVLTVFMTSVFVETLGAIVIMIKFAFKTNEEVETIKILNEVVKNYQKYKESVDDQNE